MITNAVWAAISLFYLSIGFAVGYYDIAAANSRRSCRLKTGAFAVTLFAAVLGAFAIYGGLL